MVARYQRAGLCVRVTDHQIAYSNQLCHHVYVASNEAAVTRLHDIEEQLATVYRGRPSGRATPQLLQLETEFGQELGYPACCVAAFGERLHLRTTEGVDQEARQEGHTWRWRVGGIRRTLKRLLPTRWQAASPHYYHAASAWVAQPAPRLNIFRAGEGASLISFEPCSFRCDAALEIQGPIAGGGTMGPMFQVRCAPCNRSAIITETPGTRRSAE